MKITKNGALTLSLADSVIWAGRQAPDGRALSEVRARVRSLAQSVADDRRLDVQIFACRRHGGCLLDVVSPL